MSLFTTIVGGKLVVGALAVGTVAVGGSAAVAYTGSLPAPLQEQAHIMLGAPAPQGGDTQADEVAMPTPTDSATPDATETPDPTDSPDATPTPDPTATDQSTPAPTDAATPAVTTPAVPESAHGLCTAWFHGGLAVTSVAYSTLVTAAGGDPAALPTWCASYLEAPGHEKHPGDVTEQHRGASESGDATEHKHSSDSSAAGDSATASVSGDQQDGQDTQQGSQDAQQGSQDAQQGSQQNWGQQGNDGQSGHHRSDG